ncbi:hypothetical protein LXL04_032353 [Taraxacum kok-saghyz]
MLMRKWSLQVVQYVLLLSTGNHKTMSDSDERVFVWMDRFDPIQTSESELISIQIIQTKLRSDPNQSNYNSVGSVFAIWFFQNLKKSTNSYDSNSVSKHIIKFVFKNLHKLICSFYNFSPDSISHPLFEGFFSSFVWNDMKLGVFVWMDRFDPIQTIESELISVFKTWIQIIQTKLRSDPNQ